MTPQIRLASAREILPLRTLYRVEMNCQIVHDSIHRREGWTLSYVLARGGIDIGFASVAIAGPWKEKPTLFEFYVLPKHRTRTFEFFEGVLAMSGAKFLEVQSNDTLCFVMALTYGRDFGTEKIVFQDLQTTHHLFPGAALRCVTSEDEILACQDRRQGGGEWILELEGNAVGQGGILFHYNHPYGDLYMEVDEPFRQRGLGSYLVQELKRVCYELGAVPCARCNPTNVASRRTLERAGFFPFAHIVTGSIA